MSADGSSIDVMAEFGIVEADEVAELLKLRHSTVLDLSRRGLLPAFKIGKHWRYRRGLDGVDDTPPGRSVSSPTDAHRWRRIIFR